MANLPREVISLILSYLPVKPLLRFRSTSKLFHSLIDSPYFISLDLKNSSNNILILCHNSKVHIVGFNTLDVSFDIVCPFKCHDRPFKLKVIGSCNGLLCVASRLTEYITLWNPCMRKCKAIFSLPMDTRRIDESHTKKELATRHYGLGYDSKSNDYKIVKISYYSDALTGNKDIESWVKVYSLRTCSASQSLPYILTASVFVGGNLYWAVPKSIHRDSPDMIIAFDLKCDEFKEVPMPPNRKLGIESYKVSVVSLGRDLCMFVNYRKRADVWVMKEYGNKESWCNLFTFYHSDENRSLVHVEPLSYSRDEKKVLLEVDKKRLCWFDLKSKRTSFVTLTSETSKVQGLVCVGSLVTPALLS